MTLKGYAAHLFALFPTLSIFITHLFSKYLLICYVPQTHLYLRIEQQTEQTKFLLTWNLQSSVCVHTHVHLDREKSRKIGSTADSGKCSKEC